MLSRLPACLFLAYAGNFGFALHWIDQITLNSFSAYRMNGHYPCVYREYSGLALHPKPGAEYRKDATTGSVLYPSLAVWAALIGNEDLFGRIADFKTSHMRHSTWQLWVPDDISELHLYVGSATHGAAISDFPLPPARPCCSGSFTKPMPAGTSENSLRCGSDVDRSCLPLAGGIDYRSRRISGSFK